MTAAEEIARLKIQVQNLQAVRDELWRKYDAERDHSRAVFHDYVQVCEERDRLEDEVQSAVVNRGRASLAVSAALKVLIAWAKEKDYQLWIERVEEGPGHGVYIEDGGVAAIAETETAEVAP